MLSPQALVKGLIRRYLPEPSPEGGEVEGILRLLRYREAAVVSLMHKAYGLADEGSYFITNNAQTGIIETTNTGFVVTSPTLYWANGADASDPNAKTVYPDYVDLQVSAAGATGTAVQGKALALYLDKGNNYSSGGSNLTPNIVNVNGRVAGQAVSKIYFGALTTTTPAASKGTTRVLVGQRIYRMPVTATTVPDAVGDRLRLEFGATEPEASGQFGTTGALMANVFQSIMKLPAIPIPPGWSLALYTWDLVSGGTYGTGVTWLPEAACWER